MKSLLINSDVDKIYFLIEDDIFPYPLPPEVECINVSNQTYFRKDGPNYSSSWSYMILLRAALSKIFPHLDKILSLDCDTIVNENISDLWDIPLDGYYVAGAKELKKSGEYRSYVNTGVMLFNLKELRENGKDDEIIYDLNTYYRDYPEQDCFNELFKGKILLFPNDYNVSEYSYPDYKHIKVLHYAAIKNWSEFPLVAYYKDIDIVRNKLTDITLDIIIPYYNNVKGLDKTLKSVVYPDIANLHITVVDDCSTESYNKIMDRYPTVNFLRMNKNSGPGAARQYGIDNTTSTYIMFLDTGDYILSKYSLLEILCTINENTISYMYLWRWLNAEHGTYSSDWNPLLHGWVIKRQFLDLYDIRFCKEGSRSNEDFGFIQSCNLMLEQLKEKSNIEYFKFNEAPVYMYTYDPNSITHLDNATYMSSTHIKGLAINATHVYYFGLKNHIHPQLMLPILCDVMIRLYKDYLFCIKYRPEYREDSWKAIREYYLKVYKQYQKVDSENLQKAQSRYMKELIKLSDVVNYRVNIIRFLHNLDMYEFPPSNY